MTLDATRSTAAWGYLLPAEVGPIRFVGPASRRLRADLAAGGFTVRYEDGVEQGASDTGEFGALVVSRPVDRDALRELVCGLPPGSPAILLPSAAGRRLRGTVRLCEAAGVAVDARYVTLPSGASPRLLAPLGAASELREVRELHATTTRRAGLLKTLVLLAGRAGILSRAAPGLLVVGHTPGERAPGLIERLSGELGGLGSVGLLNPSAGIGMKAIARVSGADGRAVAYLKIASPGQRADDLGREARMLRGLAEDPPRTFRAPRCLRDGEVRRHRFVATSPVPTDGVAPRGEPSPGLHRALVELASRGSTGVLAESSTWAEATRQLSALPHELAGLVQSALDRASTLCADAVLPLGIAHRDLAGWNVRLRPDGVVILDWEWARQRALPFLDLYHYVLHTEVHMHGRSLGEAYRRHFDPAGGAWSVGWLHAYAVAIGLREPVAPLAQACLLMYLVDWSLHQRELAGSETAGVAQHLDLLATLVGEARS